MRRFNEQEPLGGTPKVRRGERHAHGARCPRRRGGPVCLSIPQPAAHDRANTWRPQSSHPSHLAIMNKLLLAALAALLAASPTTGLGRDRDRDRHDRHDHDERYCLLENRCNGCGARMYQGHNFPRHSVHYGSHWHGRHDCPGARRSRHDDHHDHGDYREDRGSRRVERGGFRFFFQ